MYANAKAFPLINNNPYSFYHQARGLRQGCPLSPLLFCLYANLLLFPLSALLRTHPQASLHAFMDDILLRSPDPQVLAHARHFLHTDGRSLGLDLNLTKTNLHFICPSSLLPRRLHSQQTSHLSLSHHPRPQATHTLVFS